MNAHLYKVRHILHLTEGLVCLKLVLTLSRLIPAWFQLNMLKSNSWKTATIMDKIYSTVLWATWLTLNLIKIWELENVGVKAEVGASLINILVKTISLKRYCYQSLRNKEYFSLYISHYCIFQK